MFKIGDLVAVTGTYAPYYQIAALPAASGAGSQYYLVVDQWGKYQYISTDGYWVITGSWPARAPISAAGSGCLLSLFGIF